MKKKLILLLIMISTALFADKDTALSSESIMKIIEGKDKNKQVRLLNDVLLNDSYIDALGLMLTSGTAYQNGKKEDAAFLFYAGQIRFKSDMKNYTPKGKGGNSPAALLGAMSYQLGSVINPEIMREPVLYANVVKRLTNWDPQYSKDYSPGWEYESKPNKEDAYLSITKVKNERIEQMSDISLLLNDKEYFESFLVLQDYNMNMFKYIDDQDMTLKKEKAEAKMESIEKSKKLNGFITIMKNQ